MEGSYIEYYGFHIIHVIRYKYYEKLQSEAPRASARGICGKAKRNCADSQRRRLRSVSQPAFALRATARSPVAIPPRASARGILAKASEIYEKKTMPLLVDWHLALSFND